MAHTKSAKKRARQSEQRRSRNRSVKSRVKTELKKLLTVIENKDLRSIDKALNTVVSEIYKAASKGVIKKNNAARHISRLMKKVHQLKAGGESQKKA